MRISKLYLLMLQSLTPEENLKVLRLIELYERDAFFRDMFFLSGDLEKDYFEFIADTLTNKRFLDNTPTVIASKQAIYDYALQIGHPDAMRVLKSPYDEDNFRYYRDL